MTTHADHEAAEPTPAGLTDRLVDRLREQLHDPGGYLSIDARSDSGRLTVARSVIVDIARRAASDMPGVIAVGASLDGARFRVELVLTYGMSATAVAARARAQVHRMVEATVGLRLAEVDVHVTDVVEPVGWTP